MTDQEFKEKVTQGLAFACNHFALDDNTSQITANACGVFLQGMGFTEDEVQAIFDAALEIVIKQAMDEFNNKE